MKKTSLRQNITNKDRSWFIIDAKDLPLGKIAVMATKVIAGKNRVDYTPHTDGGDYIVITNSDKVAVSGNKETDKMYYRHSGYLGNLKSISLDKVRSENPLRILEQAVRGMLPKNKLRDERMKRLRLIIGDENTYEAQKPQSIKL